jgi:cell fate (sporulation/competence/biofilm development) regulator YlbF (YheA/YmcA/DUF963 family)
MDISDVAITTDMQEATDALATNLRQSEPFVLYRQAIAALESDSQASALIQQLSKAQTDLRARQGQGTVTQAAIESLRSLQFEAQSNGVIMNYSRTQQNAITYIRQINKEISQLLNVDFGALGRRSCC